MPNYDDERFRDVEEDKQEALTEAEELYGGMVEESEAYYQSQIDASKEWAEEQSRLQNEQTEFAIEQIEQQKEQEEKDYQKEQSGAYVDWQKQSNQYGANAEQMASAGLAGSGFSESSQVSMYNAYQARVSKSREIFKAAILNYDNAMKEARLQNSVVLAEIAQNALREQLELSLQGFQYKNQLLLELADKKMQIEATAQSRYQDVLAQINQEKALAEQIRQFNASLAEEQRQFNASLAEEQRQFNSASGTGTGGQKPNLPGLNKGNGNGKFEVIEHDKGQVNTGIENNSAGTAELAPDMNSVTDLGYGPINARSLNRYIACGLVQEVEKGGKIIFTRRPYAPATKAEADKLCDLIESGQMPNLSQWIQTDDGPQPMRK